MLSKEEQLKEWDRVIAMCKGTKFEYQEYLGVRYRDRIVDPYKTYDAVYKPYFKLEKDRIFAVAIVDDTFIWLEEPFTVYTKGHCWSGYNFTYDHISKYIVGRRDGYLAGIIKIHLDFIQWKNFTLTKPSTIDNTLIFKPKPEDTYVDPNTKQVGDTHRHYYKDVSNLTKIDIYRIIELYEVTDPCLQHALKKLLVAGNRGHKDFKTDIANIIDTLKRKLEMMEEDEA